jgi:hypothetical protein
MSLFKPTQLAAASSILRTFSAGDVHYALLCAEMQSGKTGSFQCLASKALAEELVDRVYIVCGSAERVLRDQAHADSRHYNAAAYATGTLKVLFRQDFARTAINTHRTLLIVDESHLDSSYGQQMQQFLHRHGLNLAGTSAAMRANKTYICSVSATPYAERAKIADGTALPKHVEVLQPGPGYFGLSHYKAAGLLRPSFDIAERGAEFQELLRAAGPKWILFRALDPKTVAAVTPLCAAAGVPVMEFTSKRQDIGANMERLETPPPVTTLVILKGKCRVGKVVPKQHIAFVWEDSENPNTDTLVQALPGRMCGYADAFGAEKPLLFVPAHNLDERHSALTLDEGSDGNHVSELDRHAACATGKAAIPLHGNNLIGSSPPKVFKTLTYQCPPMKLPTPPAGANKPQLLAHVRQNVAALVAEPNWRVLTAAQQAEILFSIGAPGAVRPAGAPASVFAGDMETLRVRQLRADGYGGKQPMEDYFVEVAAAHTSHTALAESRMAWRGTDSPLDISCAVFHLVKASRGGLREGDFYVVFNTYAAPALIAIHRPTRIPKTRPDTVFDEVAEVIPAEEDEDEEEDPVTAEAPAMRQRPAATDAEAPAMRQKDAEVAAPAAAAYMGIRIPDAVSDSPAAFRMLLLQHVHGVTGSIPIMGSNLRLNKVAYGWAGGQKKTLAPLLMEVGEAKGLRLSVEFGTGADYTTNMYIKSISW